VKGEQKVFKREIISVLLTAALLTAVALFGAGSAFAAEDGSGSSFAAEEISVTVDGESVVFDQSPIVIDGHTLVPIRAVCEKIGATVDWDDNSKTTEISYKDMTVALTIGENLMTVNYFFPVPLDAPPVVYNGRTLLPIRAVAETLGCDVNWDSERNTIAIDTGYIVYTPQNTSVLPKYFIKNISYDTNELVITDNITAINGYAFWGSGYELQSFSVDPGNAYFTVEDGVLFNNDKTVLIAYPQGKTGSYYKIPDSVTEVGTGAFCFADNLTDIDFSANLKKIGVDAFRGCKFTEITIPDTVTSILGCAFCNNASLQKITIPQTARIANDILSGGNPDVVVYGAANSPAETFAKKYGYKFTGWEFQQ
jgi:hypothetical protein